MQFNVNLEITFKQPNSKLPGKKVSVKHTLTVREENTMVSCVQLHQMRQDKGKTIQSSGACLRGQVSVRKFFIKCPGCKIDVNYTKNILLDILTHDLADSEIQLDLLGDENQEISLDETPMKLKVPP